MGRAPTWLMNSTASGIERLISALPNPVFTHLPRDASANKDSSRLPLFSATFDELSELIEGLPSQDIYAGYYLRRLKEAGLTDEWKAKEMVIRARRNHPSFLREYHLLVMLKENLPEGFNLLFDNEFDRIGLDFVVGIGEALPLKIGDKVSIITTGKFGRVSTSNYVDENWNICSPFVKVELVGLTDLSASPNVMVPIGQLVKPERKLIGIRSYVNTANSRYMSNIKKSYRQPQHTIPTIDLTIDRSDAVEINGYWLYPHDAVKRAVEEVVALAHLDS